MNTLFISPYFKWSEALTTDTGLVNTPDPFSKSNLVYTFRILSRVRDYCGFPLIVNSAFRTLQVHEAIYKKLGRKPSKYSYHLDGRAVDLSLLSLDENQVSKLYSELLSYSPIEIYKTNTFIHVAF